MYDLRLEHTNSKSTCFLNLLIRYIRFGCAGVGCAGVGLAGVGLAGVGLAGVGLAGVGLAGVGFAGLGFAGLVDWVVYSFWYWYKGCIFVVD